MVLIFIDIFSKGFCTTSVFVWCQFVCVRTFRASGQNILTLALTMLTEFLLYLIIWKSLTNYQSVLWKSFISHLLLLLLIFFFYLFIMIVPFWSESIFVFAFLAVAPSIPVWIQKLFIFVTYWHLLIVSWKCH